MHESFYQYTHTVAQYVRHATGKEKANLRKELEDHMADHAQALLAGGFPEDHAYRVAVESMGDPGTVGKALNKEYPLRWLILSRLVWLAVLAMALVLVLALSTDLQGAAGSLEARYTPREDHPSFSIPEAELVPLDLTETLPNGDVIHFYAAAVEEKAKYAGEGYLGHLYAVTYNRNPLRDPFYYAALLDLSTTTPKEDLLINHEPSFEGNATYFHWVIYFVHPTEPVTVQYDRHGTSFTLEIPLPWEEVPGS